MHLQQYISTFMLFFHSVFNKPSKIHYSSFTAIPLKVKAHFWCYDVCIFAQQLTEHLHQVECLTVKIL